MFKTSAEGTNTNEKKTVRLCSIKWKKNLAYKTITYFWYYVCEYGWIYYCGCCCYRISVCSIDHPLRFLFRMQFARLSLCVCSPPLLFFIVDVQHWSYDYQRCSLYTLAFVDNIRMKYLYRQWYRLPNNNQINKHFRRHIFRHYSS